MKSVTHVAIGALTYTNYLMLSGNKIDILDIPIVLTFSVLPDIDISSSKISSKLRNIPLNLIIYGMLSIFSLIILYMCLVKQNISHYYILSIPTMVVFLKLFSKNKILKKISLSLFFVFLYYLFFKYSKVGSTKNIFLFLAVLPYFTHRGLSHSILSVIIIAITLYPLSQTDTLKSYYTAALISYSSHLFLGDIFTKKGIKLFYPLSKKDVSFNVFKSSKIYNNLDTPFLIIYGILSIFIFLNFFAK